MPTQFNPIVEHLRKVLTQLQVGRVSPAAVEDVKIEAYNTSTSLGQLASIVNQGALTLLIQPWDKSIIKEIVRGLRTCGRDYNPVVDGVSIRLPFPPLTEEKRKTLVKQVMEHCAHAKIQIKQVREELLQDLKKKKNDSTISEDSFFAEQKALQKQVDQYHQIITQLQADKEADIMKL